MQTLILALHFLVCTSLVLAILVQQGKAGSGGIMSGASNTMFGSLGSAPFMVKLTAALALVFFITSFTLSYLVKIGPSKGLVSQVVAASSGGGQ
jgi:preprotein translocase subunit SecG